MIAGTSFNNYWTTGVWLHNCSYSYVSGVVIQGSLVNNTPVGTGIRLSGQGSSTENHFDNLKINRVNVAFQSNGNTEGSLIEQCLFLGVNYGIRAVSSVPTAPSPHTVSYTHLTLPTICSV